MEELLPIEPDFIPPHYELYYDYELFHF